jgi:hypothetical protein
MVSKINNTNDSPNTTKNELDLSKNKKKMNKINSKLEIFGLLNLVKIQIKAEESQ